MAIAFLATIAAQMGSAWINSSRNKVHSKKMAELQRAYEEKATREGIENARAELAELCSFQREIEKQSQIDRMDLLRSNHEQNLIHDAYENSLLKWPLLVPPYVIANAPLTLGPTVEQCIPLNCILTTSSDLGFNNNVFHKLEEQLARFCSKYWNVSSNKSIRFFQEAWKDDAKDLGSRHKDIYAHLKNVPTFLICPVLKNDTILFRFYWWGLSLDPSDAHIDELNELNPELSIPVTPKMKYDDEVINLIIQECVPKLEAFISFFADLYYWNFYSVVPSLPNLISQGYITIGADDKSQYFNTLSNVFNKSLTQKNRLSYPTNSWVSFIPTFSDVNDFVVLITNYIKALPDCRISDCNSLISEIKEIPNLSGDSINELNKASNRISHIIDQIRHHNITWKIVKSDYLSVLDVIKTCQEAMPLLPECDSFNIIKRDDKLAVIAFFSHNGEIVAWDDFGVWIFMSPKFFAPKDLFLGDRFSCDANSLELYYEIIEKNMNKEDVLAIIDAQYEQIKQELRPAASKLEDVFSNFVNSLKETIAQEQVSKEVETFNRKELKYEDIVKWLRSAKAIMGSIPFNGAFLTKGKGGFFDKYHFKMYVCLTNDRQPLADENHPKVIFSYDKTDDTLDDMFGKNESVQLNFK